MSRSSLIKWDWRFDFEGLPASRQLHVALTQVAECVLAAIYMRMVQVGCRQLQLCCYFPLGITNNVGVASPCRTIPHSACTAVPACRQPCPPCCLQVQVSREVQRVRDYEAMQLRCYQVGMVKCAANHRLPIS